MALSELVDLEHMGVHVLLLVQLEAGHLAGVLGQVPQRRAVDVRQQPTQQAGAKDGGKGDPEDAPPLSVDRAQNVRLGDGYAHPQALRLPQGVRPKRKAPRIVVELDPRLHRLARRFSFYER